MSATVAAGGVELAYEEAGSGQPVVFAHGTATGRSVWREVREALGDGCRTIAYDRRGYGESEAPEPYGGTTVGEQADDLAELIERLDAAPAVLCGAELGALACLDLVLRRPELARAAVLVEPPVLWLVPDGSDAVSELREAVERGVRDGGAGGAVTAFLEATAGRRALELLGEERLAAARAAPRPFGADLAAAASWPAGRRELRSIAVPLTVIAGSHSEPARLNAARALAELSPGAKLVELDTGSMAHLEDSAAVAAQISSACA